MGNNPYKNTWETYTQSWSEIDAAKRLQLFEECLSPDCVYIDPLMQAAGYEQLAGYMAMVWTPPTLRHRCASLVELTFQTTGGGIRNEY